MHDTATNGNRFQSVEDAPGDPDRGVPNPVIAQLRSEVKELRKQVEAVQKHLKYSSWRGKMRRWFARRSCMRLHIFEQYKARPIEVPEWYRKPLPLKRAPLISIVTPSFNQGQFLEHTIRSVLEQDYPRIEYAVQDGGSRDESAAVIDRFRERLAHGESRADRGQGNAINLGFAHARQGEIMAYLNSDDLLLPGTLNYVAAYFEAHPDVDVVYGHRVIIDTRGLEIGRWIIPGHSDKMLLWADYVPQETLFWRRRIWDAAGGKIDESFQFALDWDLLLRFRQAGAKFVRLPRFLGAFRVHEAQKTSAELAEKGVPEMERLRLRVHGRETDLYDIRRNMNGYMLRHAWLNFLYQVGLHRA